MNARQLAERLARDAIAACDPAALVRAELAARPAPAPTTLVAVGKCAAAMTRGAHAAAAFTRSLAIIPAGYPAALPAGVEALSGGHPRPNAASVEAGQRLLAFVDEANAHGEHLVVLVSGGASASVCVPAPGLSVGDKCATIDALMASGAPIDELNCVRTALSAIKGGRLAARLVRDSLTLVVSDVQGDDLALVGSGLTVAGDRGFADAREILRRRLGDAALPAAVPALLVAGGGRRFVAAAADGAPVHSSRLIAPSTAVREAAVACAAQVTEGLGVAAEVIALPTWLASDAEACAAALLKALPGPAASAAQALVIAAGEPTVVVPPAAGASGRAHHLALLLARALAGRAGYGALIVGTDGIDGQSGAAGAWVDGETWAALVEQGLAPEAALVRADAARVLRAVGASVGLGSGGAAAATGVNYADLMILVRGAMW